MMILIGYLASFLNWALLWEWAFRAIGAAILGPHMIWVGKKKKAVWEAFKRKSHWFEQYASSDEKQALLDAYRVACKAEIQEIVCREMDPNDSTEIRELERHLSDEFATLLIRPMPTGPTLRYNHRPIMKHSRAYPWEEDMLAA